MRRGVGLGTRQLVAFRVTTCQAPVDRLSLLALGLRSASRGIAERFGLPLDIKVVGSNPVPRNLNR